MAGHWTDKYSFVGAAILAKDTALVSLANDELSKGELPYTYYTVRVNGDWRDGGDSSWDAVSNIVCDIPSRKFLTLGPNGQIRILGAGYRQEENIYSSGIDPNQYGLLRGSRTINGKAYVCGMNRQVFRRDDTNNWIFLSQNVSRSEDVVGFEAIDGFSASDIYAAGWKGEIWHFDGGVWRQKDSPSNQILLDVCCAGDGSVYICGKNGTLIKGLNDQWEMLDLAPFVSDLWSICWYGEQLFLATSRELFFLKNNQLVAVDFGGDFPSTCRKLVTGSGLLWSVGVKDIFEFDGASWSRID